MMVFFSVIISAGIFFWGEGKGKDSSRTADYVTMGVLLAYWVLTQLYFTSLIVQAREKSATLLEEVKKDMEAKRQRVCKNSDELKAMRKWGSRASLLPAPKSGHGAARVSKELHMRETLSA